MCGIVGLFPFETDKIDEQERRNALMYIATEALQLTQSRGKDATGVATLFDDGNYMGLKMGIPSTDFISRYGGTETDYEGFLKIWREAEANTRAFIGHCRKSSVGNSWENVNNHPIKVKDLIGVHNGTLKNHDKIFDNLNCGRDGTVDSEAIFRLLDYYSDGGTLPFTEEMLLEVTSRLEGSFACLAMNGNNPYQAITFRDDRPVEMVLVRPLKTVFIASETDILKQSLYRFNKAIHLYNMFPKEFRVSEKVLDFKMLPNMSLAIFDLTTEIDENTTIEETYEYANIPKAKKWDELKTKQEAAKKKEEDDKKAADDAKAELDKKKDKTEVDARSATNVKRKTRGAKEGFVWNNALHSYQPDNSEVELYKSEGSIEIDVTDGSHEEVEFKDKGDKKEEKHELKATDNVENLVGDEAKVDDLSKPKEEVIDVKATVVEDDDTETREVDVSIDPKAIELAEKFVENIRRYSSDEELVDAIDLDSTDVLNELNHYALANRVTTYAAKWAFYKGVLAAGGGNIAEDSESANSRRFKKMAYQIARILDHDPSTEIVKGRVIDKGMRLLLAKEDSDINEEVLRNMFSAGDIRNSFTIRRLMATAQKV